MHARGVLTCTHHWNDWQESCCLGCRSAQGEQGWGAEPLSALTLGKWGDRARVSPGFCCDPALLPSPADQASKEQTRGDQKTPTLHSPKRLWSCSIKNLAVLWLKCLQIHSAQFQKEPRLTCERVIGPASYRPSPLPPLSSSTCCCCCNCL